MRRPGKRRVGDLICKMRLLQHCKPKFFARARTIKADKPFCGAKNLSATSNNPLSAGRQPPRAKRVRRPAQILQQECILPRGKAAWKIGALLLVADLGFVRLFCGG